MRRHVLIVDDEELFREICREMLEERGYTVSLAANANQALEIIGAQPVDLLVADITLPGMDGLSLIERLSVTHPELPTIVITGFLTQENMLRSLNLGVSGFLTKPFFYDELFVAVEKALGHSRATRNKLILHHYLPIIHMGKELLTGGQEELFSKTLSTVLNIGLHQIGATKGCVAVKENGGFRPITSLGFSPDELKRLTQSLSRIGASLAAETDELVLEDGVPGMTALVVRTPATPDIHGFLLLARLKSEGPFANAERQLSRLLATQAAVAINHHMAFLELRSRLKETSDGFVELIAALTQPANGATPDALEEIAALAETVARHLACSTEECAAVRRAALLYDIGKVLVPVDFQKTTALTGEERAQMRRYVEAGAAALKGTDRFGQAAAYVAAQRERWDGTGYPKGLKGPEIPLGGQIISIVSAWWAMTSHRPYRNALHPAEAIKIVEGERNRAFSPQVADAFLSVMRPEKSA